MKPLLFVLLLALSVNVAGAATVFELRTGAYPDPSPAEVYEVVVTAVIWEGFWVSEAPHDRWNAIYVYVGTGNVTVAQGDLVNIRGTYMEYYGMSEIVASPGSGGVVSVINTVTVPPPLVVTAAALMADPEPFESCTILLADGMTIVEDSATLGFGYWTAQALDGTVLNFDDFFYDDATVVLGDCYNNATGVFSYIWSKYRLEVFADGYPLVDCVVPEAAHSFGAVKALFR